MTTERRPHCAWCSALAKVKLTYPLGTVMYGCQAHGKNEQVAARKLHGVTIKLEEMR